MARKSCPEQDLNLHSPQGERDFKSRRQSYHIVISPANSWWASHRFLPVPARSSRGSSGKSLPTSLPAGTP